MYSGTKKLQNNNGGGGLCRPPGRAAWWNTRDRLINLTSEWHITHTHTSLLHQRGGQSKRLCASMPTPSRGFIFREHSWDLSGVRATDQLVSAKKKTLGVLSTIRWQIRKRGERHRYRDIPIRESSWQQWRQRASRRGGRPAGMGPRQQQTDQEAEILQRPRRCWWSWPGTSPWVWCFPSRWRQTPHTSLSPSWTRPLLSREPESESALAFKRTKLIY